MSKVFDPQQQKVLDSNSQKQLVSASAGSGKTTVMIQKITNLLLNNLASTDEILVVTFTNLASTEMRERLVKNLTEAFNNANDEESKTRLQLMLDSIETASVDTIDGFCSKMLKKYFYKTNLDPEIKIISSFSQEYYINKALDMAINEYSKDDEQELIVLCDIFEKQRNLDNLKDVLKSAFNYCVCQKDYDAFLNSVLNEYNGLDSKSCNYLNDYIVTELNKNIAPVLKLLPYFTDYPKLHKMVDNFTSYLMQISKNNNLIDNADILNSCPICNFSTTERLQKGDIRYEKLKFYIEKLRNLILDSKFLQNLKDEKHLVEISKHLNSFIKLLIKFVDCYNRLKSANNVMDFSDLERKMLNILKDPGIVQDFHNTYKYIFVDEYQDINPMQDELINTLLSSSSNLFLVGDVKQSIYGFRQSTPELFIDAYKSYKQNSNVGTAFDMNINFRSAPQILNFNNEIFSALMTEEKTDIDYANTSKFEAKRDDFPNVRSVKILISNTDNEGEDSIAQGIYDLTKHKNASSTISPSQLEARIVLKQINELVGTEFYDSAKKEMRILEYGDIAILSRSISDSKVQNLAKLLTENNIPINISNRTNLKDSEALAQILSILKIINFSACDVDYTYFFTSPLVQLTYNELLQVYTNKDLDLYNNLLLYIESNNNNISKKINKGFEICAKLRLDLATLNNIELINNILNKYHLRQYIIACSNGESELKILEEFLNSLSSEDANLTLTKFIDLLQKNMSSSNEVANRDSINSVTIQTIHASKGLEYPVVILFNSSNQFRYIKEHSDLNFDLELGIGMQYYDLIERKRYESPVRYAISIKNKQKAYKEELRLLYVATTRAKNMLIITGCCSEDKLKENTLPQDNYLNLILSCYYEKINTNYLATKYEFANCYIEIFDDLPMEECKTIKQKTNLVNDKIINNNIMFKYPYQQETNISIKNNVTALSRILNDDYNIIPVKLDLKENLQALPDDLANIGTNYHKVLANLDYCLPYIQPNCDDIDENLIHLAYEKISPLCNNCNNIYHERQFMMYVPYNEIFKDSNISTKILVQGVVDLIIEYDEHIVLIDYKYSSSNINTLCEKYKQQIRLYKIAIEKAYKKPVTESYIYSIKTGELKSPL